MRASGLAALCAVLVASACGGTGKRAQSAARGPDGEPRYLELIPADTPYVFATAKRPPREPIARELARSARKADRLLLLWHRFRDRYPERYDDLPMWERLFFEFLGELQGTAGLAERESLFFDERALAAAGIRLDPHVAVYGLGLHPAARVELLDGDRLAAILGRVFERARVDARAARFGGQDYWTFPLEGRDLVVVVAVIGDDLVAGLLPAGHIERRLPALFGAEPPTRSLALSGGLAGVVDRYQFAAWSAGYVELRALARELAAGDGALTGGDRPDPACAEELPALALAAPRVVFGTHGGAADRTTGAVVIELREDVAGHLLRMTAPVPGMRRDLARGAAIALGAGVDLGRLLAAAEARFAAIAASPYQCGLLAELNLVAGQMAATLRSLRGSALSGVTGMNLLIERIELDAGGAPREIEGFVFLGAKDPAGVLALAAGLLGPQLTAVTPGAPPVRLVLPGYDALLGETYLAAGDRAVGISIGAGTEGRLTELLARGPAPDPLLFLAHVQPQLLGEIRSRGAAAEVAEIAALDPDLAQALADLDESEYDHYEALLLVGRAIDRGLEIRFEATHRRP